MAEFDGGHRGCRGRDVGADAVLLVLACSPADIAGGIDGDGEEPVAQGTGSTVDRQALSLQAAMNAEQGLLEGFFHVMGKLAPGHGGFDGPFEEGPGGVTEMMPGLFVLICDGPVGRHQMAEGLDAVMFMGSKGET